MEEQDKYSEFENIAIGYTAGIDICEWSHVLPGYKLKIEYYEPDYFVGPQTNPVEDK